MKLTRNRFDTIRPLSLSGSLALFAVPTAALWAATRIGIPYLRQVLAGPEIVCWFAAGGSVFFCLFTAALVAFCLEKHAGLSQTIVQRFRLGTLSRSDVVWSISTLGVCGVLSGIIALAWQSASQSTHFISAPTLAPPFLITEPVAPFPLWVLAAWLPMFFFNIAGEEFWWRGYMLPRQEKRNPRFAWVVHGIGLTLFHLPLGVDLAIILLPFLFGLPWIAQRRRNTWTGFIVHGLLNGGGFLALATGLA